MLTCEHVLHTYCVRGAAGPGEMAQEDPDLSPREHAAQGPPTKATSSGVRTAIFSHRNTGAAMRGAFLPPGLPATPLTVFANPAARTGLGRMRRA